MGSTVGFARAGATCSNKLTDRPFPPLTEHQLPDYFNATRNGTIPPPSIIPHETMYAIWIGTNDVGANALLTQDVGVRRGVSIVEVRKCVVDVVRALYESGARYFVIMNVSLVPCFRPRTSWQCPIPTRASTGLPLATEQSGASSCTSSSEPGTQSRI